MKTQFKIIAAIVGAGMVAAGLIVWLIFFTGPAAPVSVDQAPLGSGETRNTSNVPAASTETDNSLPVTAEVSTQKIFKVADGPVAGAVLLQTSYPTTTVARFVLQNSGHIFDFTLDSPGAVPKPVSNTTIPGIVRTVWAGSRAVLLQYIDADAVKTAHLTLPAVGSTTPVRIQFLPANITDLAVSPDGTSVAYLLRSTGGADGYTAAANGANPKKLFSLPLSQISLSWPSQGTLVAVSAPAAEVAGIAFSIDAKSGAVAPLLFAAGLTAVADRSFGAVVYQTVSGGTRSTYVHNTRTGLAKGLSFDPYPERCVWGIATSTLLYCAVPLSFVAANYIDLWRQGTASAVDSVLSFNTARGTSDILASPGSSDGGEKADIAQMAISPSGNYLLYTHKGDRSLWGVRL